MEFLSGLHLLPAPFPLPDAFQSPSALQRAEALMGWSSGAIEHLVAAGAVAGTGKIMFFMYDPRGGGGGLQTLFLPVLGSVPAALALCFPLIFSGLLLPVLPPCFP